MKAQCCNLTAVSHFLGNSLKFGPHTDRGNLWVTFLEELFLEVAMRQPEEDSNTQRRHIYDDNLSSLSHLLRKEAFPLWQMGCRIKFLKGLY